MIDNEQSEEKKTLRDADLRQFTGTESWYRHSLFSKYLYTDGVRYVARNGGAYWLIDKIFACQSSVPGLAEEGLIVWELIRDPEGPAAVNAQADRHRAKLRCTNGNCKELYSETILYTDFPLQKIRFYFQNNVLFLPSEY